MRKSIDEFDRLDVGNEQSTDKVDVKHYMQLVGSMLWVANMTVPDIAYYYSRLAMYSIYPTKQHEYFEFCVIGYLVKTAEKRITYGTRCESHRGWRTIPTIS